MGHGRLDEGGRRVGVVLGEFRWAYAVTQQIEPPDDADLLRGPALADEVFKAFWNLEVVPQVALDDVLDGLQAEIVQGIGGCLDGIDFRRREDVAGGFVPVGLALVGGVVGEADRLDAALPVGAGGERDALHGYAPMPLPCDAVLPKPPRGVLDEPPG